jgi:GNAT superfamily N-acetyltransferase
MVAALEEDPFYLSISEEFTGDVVRRQAALAQYFDFSIQQGKHVGRTVQLTDPARAIAVWRLPQPDEVRSQADREKRAFLEACLGTTGKANYYQIIEYMSTRAKGIVSDRAWYLSIVAVDPRHQGWGLGRQVLAPTLREADADGAVSYLETFNPRNVRFYERLGFKAQATFTEPTTRADYAVMVRYPQTR